MSLQTVAWLVIALCLLERSTTAKAFDVSSRIVGGELTTIDRVPYMVQIWSKGKFNCGGALLTRNFILTAAHCVHNVMPADLFVVAGVTTLADTAVKYKVVKILKPASFSMFTMDKDVAVLKLATSIQGRNTQTAELYSGNLFAGQQVEIAGWGRTSEMGNISYQIRSARVPVISKSQCQRQYSRYIYLTENMFCAGVPGAKDTCSGDSGGPVMCNGKICGIVSFGVGCARPGLPGVYTTISEVRPFIEACLKR
ncbi:seminase-like [Musca domestica]|uniref:Seminase-like n=1 Tax=Musca domestica TaxID=7370 RepID=A0A9J7D2C0_MUSDO|nr:seminase-like [Musca domestica]